jgi:hypothetical protein
MKKILFFVIIIFIVISAKSQVVKMNTGNFDGLSAKYDQYMKTVEEAPGYRFQVMYSATREETNAAKTKFYQNFPNIRAYVDYEQPYYKLRVGDFRNKLQLTKNFVKITSVYPSAFTVRDDVKIR